MKRLSLIIVAGISLIAVTSLIVVTIVLSAYFLRQRLQNKLINRFWSLEVADTEWTENPERWVYHENNKLSIEDYPMNRSFTGSYKIISGNSLEVCVTDYFYESECKIFKDIRANDLELFMNDQNGDEWNFSSRPSIFIYHDNLPTDLPTPDLPPPVPAGMVPVPAGNFQMGCDTTSLFDCSEANFAHEVPLHTVYLDDYYIDIHEVTNSQYAQCVAAGACEIPKTHESDGDTWYADGHYDKPQFGNYPVVWIPWDDANNYCTWAGKSLPTEAQWEKAARGSSDTRIWPWGNTPPDCSLANYWRDMANNEGKCGTHTPEMGGDDISTSAVGSYPQGASPYGVMDMAGNVSEFVMDFKNTTYYQEYAPDAWPANPINEEGIDKGHRGGSWDTSDLQLRVSYRSSGGGTDGRSGNVGFRCASSPPTDTPEPLPGGPTPSDNRPTPPPGAATDYSCAFNVNVPAELTKVDDSHCCVTFTPTSNPTSQSIDEPVWVRVLAWKKPGIDLETAFAQAVDRYGLKDPDEHAVTMLDYVSNPVPGLQSDFITGEEHYRVLVFVRPDTCFDDYAPTEVIYLIAAKAPVDSWETWEPIFDVIFQSIYMKECWGI
jgi:formylglycine-generating enzyme required for sulfatase activity